MALRSRRLRVLVGLLAALAIAAALVAPVVLSGGSGGAPCAATLAFRGSTYVARPVAGFVQAIAIGVGVTHGCGAAPANVDVRSLSGVEPARAIAVSGDESSVYVRRGVCASAARDRLLACLRG